MMLSGTLVEETNEKISDALWMSFIVAIGAIGIIIAEMLVCLMTYCICRKCFNEKMEELNVLPLADQHADEKTQLVAPEQPTTNEI